MRRGRARNLWSVPTTILYLVFFVVISLSGAMLLITANLGRGVGALLGLAFVVVGPLGAVAATVELIRSALRGQAPTVRPRDREGEKGRE